jgi:hypothetical protein
MRYTDILSEDELFEINMSPTSLRKLAGKIPDAQVGLEFEMCVPGYGGNGADDFESEPDYGHDESVRRIADVADFFRGGNSSTTVRRVVERMESDYLDWQDEKINEEWNEEAGQEFFREWCQEHVPEEEWRSSDTGEPEDEFDEFVSAAWKSQGRYYEDAFSDFDTEMREGSLSERDWLEDEGITAMSDVESHYGITWPYWTEYNSDSDGSEPDLDSIADSWGDEVGDVQSVGGYHGASRDDQWGYFVETDSSLEPESGDAGVEFVSPKMGLDKMISELKKVSKWAKDNSAYTGKQFNTGLHMNVSIPGLNAERMDYMKLALLLGDKHVLQEFDRLVVKGHRTNYAKSSLEAIVSQVKANPKSTRDLLNRMADYMEQGANKVVATKNPDKYYSINVKLQSRDHSSNRIEFRGPGGDWLNEYADKPEKFVNTLRRFVVVLDAACDPEKYRQEYQKKLYKLLKGGLNEFSDDTIKYFAQYVVNRNDSEAKSILSSFIKSAQLERAVKRGKDYQGLARYRVKLKGYSGNGVDIIADSYQEAINSAIDEEPHWRAQAEKLRALPKTAQFWDVQIVEKPTKDTAAATSKELAPSDPAGRYAVVHNNNQPQVVYRFNAKSDSDANRVTSAWAQANNVPRSQLQTKLDPGFDLGRGPLEPSTADTAGTDQPNPESQGRPHETTGSRGIFAMQVASGDHAGSFFRFNAPEDREHYVLRAWATRYGVDWRKFRVAQCDPNRPTQAHVPYNYEIFDKTSDRLIKQYYAENDTEANNIFARYIQFEHQSDLDFDFDYKHIVQRPITDNTQGQFEVYNRRLNRVVTGHMLDYVRTAATQEEAERRLAEHEREYRIEPGALEVRPVGSTTASDTPSQQPRQATAANGVPLWEIYERDSGHVVHTFADHSQQSAWSAAQQWLRTYAEPAAASGFSIRPKMEANTATSTSANTDEFSGWWRIVNGAGEELHRFRGMGQNQGVANQMARQWAEQTRHTGAIEVYPIMGDPGIPPAQSNFAINPESQYYFSIQDHYRNTVARPNVTKHQALEALKVSELTYLTRSLPFRLYVNDPMSHRWYSITTKTNVYEFFNSEDGTVLKRVPGTTNYDELRYIMNQLEHDNRDITPGQIQTRHVEIETPGDIE